MPTKKSKKQSKALKTQNKENVPSNGPAASDLAGDRKERTPLAEKTEPELNIANEIDDDEIEGFNNFEKFFPTGFAKEGDPEKHPNLNGQQRSILEFQQMIQRYQQEAENQERLRQQRTLELFLNDSSKTQKRSTNKDDVDSTYQSPFEQF